MGKIHEIEKLLLDMGPTQAHPTPMNEWIFFAPYVRDFLQTALCASYLPRWAAIWDYLGPKRYLCIGLLLGTAESYALRTTGHFPLSIVAVDYDISDYNTERSNLGYAYRNITSEKSGGYTNELVIIRADSRICKSHVRLGPYSYAWIDGAHNYDAVKIDMCNAWDSLEPGGVMAVHDLDLPGGDNEIRRGFRDWCAGTGITDAVEIPQTYFQLGLGLVGK